MQAATSSAPMTADAPERHTDYRRIAGALSWLTEHYSTQPTLEEAAGAAGMSPFHFQRTFSRWVGLSPKKYVQYLTLERAKRSLRESASVLDASFEAGLSGPGRLHDLFVRVEAVTPGEFKSHGAGTEIRYGVHPTPFGECLIMRTPRGTCGLAFCDGMGRDATLEAMSRGWERARWSEDAQGTARVVERIFRGTGPGEAEPLVVHARGTPFQIKVWEALLRIPSGAVTTYEDLARRIGQPTATRAVARANATNAVSWLIPCHRVIRKTGALGGYRWGLERKLAMLTYEALHGAS